MSDGVGANYGLSPPTRGSRRSPSTSRRSRGSIPAHAGEPISVGSISIRWTVYPRPRGGAWASASSAIPMAGLSPPTRGSLLRIIKAKALRRSIPAHAGEPKHRDNLTGRDQVYPRPRGGAGAPKYRDANSAGLSPPTRGSRYLWCYRGAPTWSIPAHAGEPGAIKARHPVPWVYPRPRGGAADYATLGVALWGLSPPTRGSPVLGLKLVPLTGSIPAHAGEPTPWPFSLMASTVYPRPRGGASCGYPM